MWFYNLRYYKVLLLVGGVVVTLVGLVCLFVFFAPTDTPTPPLSTPTPTPSTSVSANDHVDSPELAAKKDAFIQRVTEFEVTLRSFNWQEADEMRYARLAPLMTTEGLAYIRQADQDAEAVWERLKRNETVNTAAVVSPPIGDLNEGMTDVETRVKVQSRQTVVENGHTVTETYEKNVISVTSWVEVDGIWYAHHVDPY